MKDASATDGEIARDAASPALRRVVLFFRRLAAAGGAERIMFEESLYLQRNGIDAPILTFALEPSALFDPPYPVHISQIGRVGKGLLRQGLQELRNVWLLRRELHRLRPDVVLASSGVDCVALDLATLGTGIPFASHVHGTVFWFDERFLSSSLRYARLHRAVFDEIRASVIGHSQFYAAEAPRQSFARRLAAEGIARLLSLALRKAVALFTLTRHMAWEIEKLYGCRAIPIKGGVSRSLFDRVAKRDVAAELGLQGKRIILNVNRLDPRKRVDLAIRAFHALAARRPALALLIGGTGPEEPRLRAMVHELGIADRVRFCGFIPDDQLPDYILACDVFVHPNWAEFAISPYEALALGAKVVWSSEMERDDDLRVAGNVFVADPFVEPFTAALERALDSDGEPRADMRRYTWDEYGAAVLAGLTAALTGDKLAPSHNDLTPPR